MRKLTLAAIAAGIALAGCSERTQDSAQEMVESAAADAAANTEQVLQDGAEAAGQAAEDLDREVAETEANIQNEPVQEAQVD